LSTANGWKRQALPPFWCMDTTTFSRLIRWTPGCLPFEPEVRNGRYTGGVSNDKGVIIDQDCAGVSETDGALPVNVRFMIEARKRSAARPGAVMRANRTYLQQTLCSQRTVQCAYR
jgi:hypothetical protein